MPPVLQIIGASTRDQRKGPALVRWIERVAEEHGGFQVEVTDLRELGLPLLDEPNHPRLQQYVHQYTKDWSSTVERSDAFVIVTPEYNHSFPASLKNAIDHVFNEWAHKPVGLVSYGGVSAGLRSVAALKPVLTALRMMPTSTAVSVPFFTQFLNEDGEFVPPAEVEGAGKAMLDELATFTEVLRPLRSVAA